MNPKTLELWNSLLDEKPLLHSFKFNNYFLKRCFRDQSLYPLYKKAIRSNPYLLPYIEDFLETLLYLNKLTSTSKESMILKAYNRSTTLESFREAIHHSPKGAILYHGYISFYFTSIAHQSPQNIKTIALRYKREQNFKDFLTTGKVSYES